MDDYRYFITLNDDISHKVLVYFLKVKFEVFLKFKLWKVKLDNQINKNIKYLQTNNGTKYIDSVFQKVCVEHLTRGIFQFKRYYDKMVWQKE